MKSWEVTAPKWILRESREVGGAAATELQHLSVSEYRGIVPRRVGDDGQAASEDAGHYKRCRPGDVVLNKLWAFRGGIGTSPSEGLVSPAYAVFHVGPRADPWFLHYLFRSPVFVAEMASRVKGLGGDGSVPGRSPHINVRDFVDISIHLPPLETQRRIADYLDAETARIDVLIAMNMQLSKLTQERWRALLEEEVMSAGWPRAPLWLVAELTPGYAYASDDFLADGENRLMRGINVDVTGIRWDEVVYGADSTVAETSVYQLNAGDLVMGMDRPWIGRGLRVARVSHEDLPAFLVQRVLRLRARPEALSQDFLFLALHAPSFYAAFEPDMTGVSVPHVSASQVGAFMVPLPSQSEQRCLVKQLEEARTDVEKALTALDRQSNLLAERRQALITAAVTGELEV